MNLGELQRRVCAKHGAAFTPPNLELKLGISKNFLSGKQPLNGLRHPQESETCGWFLWAGEEFSNAPDFFEPMHVKHLIESCPQILPYLALPPGWRFLIADNCEDVWKDSSLLHLDK